MVYFRKGQVPILIFNLFYLVTSAIIFASRKNYEFILYIGVIFLFLCLIVYTNRRVVYSNFVLWLLSLWGLLHMAGGMIIFSSGMRLYELILIPISETYSIFRYDQFVHIIGFGVATLIMFSIIRKYLPRKIESWTAIGIVTIMAGLGVGALNEIVEFIATVIVPETGVGGYINTSMDLVSDLIGVIIAFLYIKLKESD